MDTPKTPDTAEQKAPVFPPVPQRVERLRNLLKSCVPPPLESTPFVAVDYASMELNPVNGEIIRHRELGTLAPPTAEDLEREHAFLEATLAHQQLQRTPEQDKEMGDWRDSVRQVSHSFMDAYGRVSFLHIRPKGDLIRQHHSTCSEINLPEINPPYAGLFDELQAMYEKTGTPFFSDEDIKRATVEKKEDVPTDAIVFDGVLDKICASVVARGEPGLAPKKLTAHFEGIEPRFMDTYLRRVTRRAETKTVDECDVPVIVQSNQNEQHDQK